jgi:hypothetical protein
MNTETLRVVKWFWAWEDYKEEAWLGEMSHTGWHLKYTGFPTVYTFLRGDPLDYVYRLDFISSGKGSKNEYFQLFQDAGWEHISAMGGWQYFRKLPRPGEEPEIYTDNESKIEKYRRVLLFMVIMMVVLMPSFMTIFRGDMGQSLRFIQVIYTVLAVFYTFAIVKLVQRINQLKRK